MAFYKHDRFLMSSTDAAFDLFHDPGTAAPHPGIYRCTNCGDEIAVAGGHALPPQNHRQHDTSSGPVHWQLLVLPGQRSA